MVSSYGEQICTPTDGFVGTCMVDVTLAIPTVGSPAGAVIFIGDAVRLRLWDGHYVVCSVCEVQFRHSAFPHCLVRSANKELMITVPAIQPLTISSSKQPLTPQSPCCKC